MATKQRGATAQAPSYQKGKTFLEKRAFLSNSKNDASAVLINVRTFDYGGSDADFKIVNDTHGLDMRGSGFTLYCPLGDPAGVKETNERIETLIGFLNEFKKAINVAAKEAQRHLVNG